MRRCTSCPGPGDRCRQASHSVAQPGGTPPRNWVHKKIPDCAVELNTQNCASFGSQISLITAMGFREAMPPRTTHQGLCPWTPLGDFRSPADPLCPHLQILAAPLQALHRHSTGRGDCGKFCMGLPLLHAWLPRLQSAGRTTRVKPLYVQGISKIG